MTLQFVDDLRPNPEPFDPDWSAETLASILAVPTPKPRISRRRLLLITLPAAMALAIVAVVAPSFVGRGGDVAGPGASAAAAEVLIQAANALDDQIPGKDEYLYIKHVDRYWENGRERAPRGTFEDWIPGDRSKPMIEQTIEDGRILDTGAHSLEEYQRPFYTDHGRDPDDLLKDLNNLAISQDNKGELGANVWGQAFRELQNAGAPVQFKAAVFRALVRVPGVSAVPTTNRVGSLEGTALIFKHDPLAFIFDSTSGVFLGFSMGLDNPSAPAIETQMTGALVTSIVKSAPEPDYGP